ncbi:MAG: hypothetical protein KIH08_06385 [Candidatus Freyarchaeota archaeon]|nr:hypothetical protein [Candidatus Jordarchaeia archaeon]MBS7269249.1 hypothetical protein [Candidatus Jordarchaeia archaeon]MBS7280119.1 hypothetical protein [Candidatus Jordarchaeia archaeon]
MCGGTPEQFFDRFRKPRKEATKEILEKIGIHESDEGYGKLEADLYNLMGRRSREAAFSEFFWELSKLLYRKTRRELDKRIKEAKEEVRKEALEALNEQIPQIREQLKNEILVEPLLQGILVIGDRLAYSILKLLQGKERSHEWLRRNLNLGNSEFVRRINCLTRAGLVELCYSNNRVDYTLSNTAKTILNRKGAEFDRLIDLLADDKAY